MKKILLGAAFLSLALTAQMNAQTQVASNQVMGSTGFYVGVHGGYNFGIAKDFGRGLTKLSNRAETGLKKQWAFHMAKVQM